jgi:dihydroneopterin aldolase
MDTIAINGISCEANIGVSEHERTEPQLLMIDVLLKLDLEAAANEDSISLTCDYDKIVARVRKLIADHEFKLLEAVAGHLCKALLTEKHVQGARVTVRKFPQNLSEDIDHIAVDMERS